MTQQVLSPQVNSLRTTIGSSVLFLYILISVPAFGIVVLACLLIPFPLRYKVANSWAASIMWMTKILCGLSYQVEGLEKLPKNQGFVLLSKHQSSWETLALRLFLPIQSSVLKRSLTWIPIGGWALSTLKPIAIDRNSTRAALRTLISEGTERLNEGLVVIIFPEGTRAAPGENKPFKIGGALLAEKSGYPVIPLAHNAGEFWPRYSFLKYPGTISVKIGSAIETKGKKAKEINAEAEAWIAQAMKELPSHNKNT